MTDPWIEYGKGCDIDPEKIRERFRNVGYSRTEEKLLNALQQREERREEANESIMIHHITCKQREGNPYADGKRHGLVTAFAAINGLTLEEATLILEGTDG
ncbi:MAG: hypothetical protein CMF59_16725 [Leptospiraceae bacterium]|nr:hypothetical protein [Leptospiraceae bacterium]